ncbi:MAG: CopD family protein [Candidatus Sericytochromatia bacterium]|nr:CopD family protein [Candidatus Sericytochromatia bacterium]
MDNLYLVLKTLHVVAVIAWMAGLLYLFRLFVYHGTETEPVVRTRLVEWERRLYTYIANPAMAATWLLGLGMTAVQPGLWQQPWLHAKLALVVLMTGVHHAALPLRRRLAAHAAVPSDVRLRILNEVPTLLMIGIVALVILKPWAR